MANNNIIKAWGVSYDNDDGVSRQSLIEKLEVGDFVRLVEEPTNPTDKLAIAICNDDGKTLGYIGKNDPMREPIRRAMRHDNFFATIVAIPGRYPEKKKDYSEGLRISVGNVIKDGDNTTATWNKPDRPNTEQMPKRTSKVYKEALVKYKRHHPERLSWHELEALKERRVG